MPALTVDLAANLTPKERRFVEAYMGDADGNGTRAAQLAGYRGNSGTLGAIAYETLKRPHVREAIAALAELDPLVMGRIERMRRLTKIARGELTDQRIGAEGEVYEMRVPVREQHAAIRTIAELVGDFRAAKESEKEDPLKGLSAREMFDLAGIPQAVEGAN